MNRRPTRVAALFLLGSLLVQTAWILALPPFRGIDEFDHAYRAAAVAEGEWKPAYVRAPHGRGWLLEVPESLVRAATPVCEEYTYTGHDNCYPARRLPHGQALVASGAANYNPVFYWIIGFPASLFTGAASLLVMRLVASVLCSAFIGLAAWILASWRSTQWPLLALAIALSPMVLYSTALGAPNGIEMVAALAFWAALLGIRQCETGRAQRRLLLLALPGGVVLAGVRSLGPLWLALIVVSVALVLGKSRLVSLIRTQRGPMSAAASVLACATASGIWWTLSNSANAPVDAGHPYGNTLAFNLELVPLWIFQSIAAFPLRNEQASPIVYACVLLVLCTYLCFSLTASRGRIRFAIAICAVFSVAISSSISYATFDTWGAVWQGRYALPYMVGIPLVASLALDAAPRQHVRMQAACANLGFALLAVAQTASVGGVLLEERQRSPLAGTAEWHIPPLWLIIGLASGGVALWLNSTRQGRRDPVDAMPRSAPGTSDGKLSEVGVWHP